MKKKLVTTTGFILFSSICIAQDNLKHSGTNDIQNDVSFSPDGKWLDSASSDKTLELWQLSNQ